MRQRWTMAALGGLLALACVDVRPVPPRDRLPRAAPDASAALSDAPALGAPKVGVDAGTPPDAAPVAPQSEWKLIDSGRGPKGMVQPCPAQEKFETLASVLAKPFTGPLAVRGRAWIPASYPCTAAIPEVCFATPVLAAAKPTDETRRQIFLLGYLEPNEQLACMGPRLKLSCPIPVEGREFGVTGTLRIGGDEDAPVYELEVRRLCSFVTGAGR